MKIVRCGHVLAPEPLGARDPVVAGERIVAVAAPGVEIAGLEVEVRDLRGFTVTPGFIDNHVHVLGGGGGLGFVQPGAGTADQPTDPRRRHQRDRHARLRCHF
jgi:imidazolonepropionase-like amidohydrolase